MTTKSVKINKTEYEVEITEDSISACETYYPLPGYGNNYGTCYNIYEDGDDEYYKTEIRCYNNDWACRGHGMLDRWTEAEGFIRKDKIDIEKLKEEFEQTRDGSFRVYKLFKQIKQLVLDSIDPRNID